MEMEKKLAKYRAQKAREAKINELKGTAQNFLEKIWKKQDNVVQEPLLVPPEKVSDQLHTKEEDEEEILSSCSDEELNCCTWVDIAYYCLCFVLWLILYAVFIEFQFGTVFLVISALIFMYVNTRTGPRRRGEVSAYSVFNKNCKSIDGTLKAEQFEREIRYGSSVVK